MKFGRYPVPDCEGATLAHSVQVATGYLSKGRVLTGDDVAALSEAGIADVMVAILEPGDIDENTAARRMATTMAGAGLRTAEAKRGRVNLYARAAGLLTVDQQALLTLNRLDEGISVATMSEGTPVEAGQLIGTVKIVPFALPKHIVPALTKAVQQAKG